jgi:hypothetical protein
VTSEERKALIAEVNGVLSDLPDAGVESALWLVRHLCEDC